VGWSIEAFRFLLLREEDPEGGRESEDVELEPLEADVTDVGEALLTRASFISLCVCWISFQAFACLDW
jgi:hypothetical protein